MKNLIQLFIFFLFISGCTKIGKTVTIKGRVLNPITGEGIAGAKIKLLRTTLGLPGGNKAIKTVVSDANGDYELSKLTLRYLNLQWNAPEGQEYLGLGFKDSETGEAMGTHVKKFKTQHWDYHAVPMFQYKLSVNNISCFNANDSIIISRANEAGSFNGVNWPIVGCSGYQTARLTLK